ncbi:MAG: arginine deiminase-related protein [Acidobacteriota bacterium]|nr:arginine deiminase-related protein [Acidobacteriota bacterium]
MSFIANKILMVRPAKFGFNPQTAESNAFQKEVDLTDEEIQENAVWEFDSMVNKLRENGIEVLICDDSKNPYTPDAVFPNNWFSTHAGGTLCLYPMEAEARRFERNPQIINKLKENFVVAKTLDFTEFENQNKFLEGTGSLVLDHENKIAYASISSRTNEDALKDWSNKLDFEIFKFRSFDRNGKAIYHTNVMMCLGDDFAVACLKSISEENEKRLFREKLYQTGKEIIEISFEQMNNFAGNMLLLQNKKTEKILVLSKTAFESLNKKQIEKLGSHAKLLSFDIDIIEKCGGGSVRCMIAEIFY